MRATLHPCAVMLENKLLLGQLIFIIVVITINIVIIIRYASLNSLPKCAAVPAHVSDLIFLFGGKFWRSISLTKREIRFF